MKVSKLAKCALLVLLASCADRAPAPVAPSPPPAVTPPAASAAPTPDPPTVTEGNVTVAFARGMEILVKRTPGAEFAAAPG